MPGFSCGGAEVSVLKMVEGLQSLRIANELVVASSHGPLRKDFRGTVHSLLSGRTGVFLSLFPLVRLLRKIRPAFFLSVMTHTNVIALVAWKFSGVKGKIFVSERNTRSPANFGWSGWKQVVIDFLARKMYAQADGIFAVSRAVAADLSKRLSLPPDRISILPNPVVSSRLGRLAKAATPHPWLLPRQPPVVLAAGRLVRQKNFSDLIRAFEAVRSHRPCRLVILGEGNLRGVLERQIQLSPWTHEIMLAGYQANPFCWMSRSKVFVLSSLWEGLPGVLIQAMACGTRVVSTDCPGGSREILQNGRWGVLVPLSDVPALAKGIERAMDRGPSARALRQRASFYSVSRSVELHLKAMGWPGKNPIRTGTVQKVTPVACG